jgi:type III secretion protein J
MLNVKNISHYISGAFYLLCLTLIVFSTGCSSQKRIVNGLEERDANEIIVLLDSKGINATKVPNTAAAAPGGAHEQLWDIEVAPEQSLEAMSILNQAGLPRPHRPNLLQLFSNTSLVPSEEQEKIRYQAGLAQEIANTIRQIDGVIDANVVISYPPENPLKPGEMTGPITASVFVKHNGVFDDPNLHLKSKIKRLVSAAVSGLSFDNVTVVGERAQLTQVPTEYPTPASEELNMPVQIWSVTVAEDSVFRFRAILFSFLTLILLLILFIVWMMWKVHLIAKKQGLRKWFSLAPLHIEKPEVSKEEKPAEQPKEETKLDKKEIDNI